MSQRKLEAADVNLFKSLGDPHLSPDGRWVAWVQQSPEPTSDRNSTNIWVAATDGSGRARQLTSSDTDRHPRWSPQGRALAFVSERSGKAQIWLIRPDGGEAWHLPTEQTVSSPASWSPDGRRLAYVAKVFPAEWQPYPGAPANDRERALTQAQRRMEGDRKHTNGGNGIKVITRLKYRFDGTGYYGDLRPQVFAVDVAGPGRPAPSARQITSGNYDHDSPAWTPDGQLVVAAVRRADADRHAGGQLWLYDPAAEAPEPRLLYEGTGPAMSPVVSPDGKLCAFLGHDEAHSRSTTQGLLVIPMPTGSGGDDGADDGPLTQADAINLTATADRPAGCPVSSDIRYTPPAVLPCWAEDSRSLYYLLGNQGHATIVRLAVPSGWPGPQAAPAGLPNVVLGGPGQVIASLDYRAGRLAYQAETPTQPSEVYAYRIAGTSGETRLSHANDDLLAGLTLAPVEPFQYAGAAGWPIEGFLMRPPDGGSGPFPTVVLIHGGPHGVYGECFMFQCQVLAAAGLAVVYTNPRGSQNYGQEFASAVAGDWGGGDFADIMAGLEHVIATGVADPERLGITGWSYGGYMTSWAISQTNRFRAAVAGAIVFNRHNFWGTSDIGYSFGTWQFAGTPWEQEEMVMARSPARFAGRVTTPLLLLHGEADLRCPVEQAEQFYQILRYRDVPAVLVRYPGEYHTFQKPSHRRDRFARARAWFEHYLLEAGE